MQKTAAFAALGLIAAALAGCNKPAPVAEEAAAPAASEAAAPQAAATLAPGVYDVTGPDGKPGGFTEVNADGSYTTEDAKGVRTAGIAKMKDGKTCFDPSGAAPEECWTDSPPAADGTFTSTSDKGETVSVKPRAK
jgi:hypothetical protein